MAYKRYTSEDGFLKEDDIADLLDNAPKCEAARSRINGFGLFAKDEIEAGETVVDFSDPDIYFEQDIEDLPEWRLRGGKFTALDEEKCVVSRVYTKYSLVNHSRNPNAGVDTSKRRIYALRRIEPGEEVTVDFRTEPMPQKVRESFERWL